MTSGARGPGSSSPGDLGPEEHQGAWERGVLGHSWEGCMACFDFTPLGEGWSLGRGVVLGSWVTQACR